MKPIFLIFGNCQAKTLTGIAVGMPPLTDAFDIVHLNSYIPIEHTGFDVENLKRVALLWEQVGVSQRLQVRQYLPPNAQIVRYGELSFLPLWPFNAPNPFNRISADFPVGPYPYGDRIALEIAMEGVMGDDIVPQYLSRGAARLPDVARLVEMEHTRAARKRGDLDVDLSPTVFADWRDRRLFASYNHPSNDLMVRLFAELIAATDLGNIVISDALWRILYEHVVVLQRGPDCEVMQMPVHPAVRDALGLTWYTPDVRFRHLTRGALTLEAFIRDFVDFTAGRPWLESALPQAQPIDQNFTSQIFA